MRVSSVTAPPLTGTLKSTRISTRFPAQSRSCTVRLAKLIASGELEQCVDDAVREAPLVVVPRQHLDHVARHDVRGQRVEHAARGVADDVVGDDGVGAVLEDALHRPVLSPARRGWPAITFWP